MNRLPSLVSPFMATKTVPERTLRESYSTPATTGFPLWERTSAPCRSCWNVIGVTINSVPLCTCVPCGSGFSSLPQRTQRYTGERLPAKTYGDARPRRDLRPGLRRLFAGNAAADSIEVEPCFLRRLNGNAQVLAEKRRHLDPSLFHVENHRAAPRQFLRRRILELCGG